MHNRDTRTFRRSLLLGLGAGLGFWVWRGARPATVHNAHLRGLSGHRPTYATLIWTYGAGARPISLIVDIELAGGAQGSVTTDGEALEAEVPLIGAPAPGPYRITVSASYRVFGLVRNVVHRFEGDSERA